MRSRGWGFKVGIAVVVAALLGGAAWGGLTWLGRDKGEARLAADRVATGLAAGKFAPGSVVADGGPPDLAALVKGMGKATHTVSVASMTEAKDGAASAILKQSWTLPGSAAPWTYETPLDVRETDGTWAGVWKPDLLAPDLVEGESLRIKRQQPTRAEILGANNQQIVTPRAVSRIGIDKTKVSASEALATAPLLAEALGINSANYVTAVKNAGPKAFVEAITVREGSPQEAEARALAAPGVFLVADTLPLAPTSTFARPLLGTVGGATAEIVEKSEGRIVAGDEVGIGGVQAAYDAQLSGQPSYTVLATGGEQERTLFNTPSTPGKPVALTLDIAKQEAAEAVLEKVVPASAIVAIQPSTGHVLAAASGPGGKGVSTATQGRYAPGSTFKMVSGLALLRSGVTPASKVECTPTVTVDGRTFKNVDSYPTSALGSVPFSTAFANSCNTAFIRAGEKLAPAELPTAAASLGLTAKPGLGVSAFIGSVPEPKPGTDEAASMIGQSKVEASPLGMATVAASIAAGKPVAPVFVVGAKAEAAPAPAKPVTAAESALLKTLMRGVVEQGSGKFLADVPGEPVLAKSGTAEFGDAKALKQHVWMIGIQGDLAVAVFVDEGEGGATTAGPLLEAYLRAIA
ncbi:putative secreted penicillin binding protein [Janibacter sp. HTCC2649]|uniref:penicillin-binding transpeptidase domain-containing protein n=1 Tax=Janibacter sp. HTCC2649 TaxID=313589 RepID=UPI0000670902|nr:penicillin-binding transpeptidase domain-containing protein [Janibacter sp. HTCC2649]EAQ00913.1 putative secreted penicillin binding protein [Janibacter sp. HTCC2649]